MKKITILFACTVLALTGFSQNTATQLWEYRPAPGQHINIGNIGTPQAAQKMTESFSSLVLLGSFGGYIILGFENGCANHPDNPYGIDFTIYGNAFSGSSEPGVVWVMQDENQDGLPDDTWYEIAGSHHFHSKTVQNCEVTYFKTGSRDVLWRDNSGETGWIMANSFNLQEYYPTAQYFPQYPEDSVFFKGTLLASAIDFSDSQEIKVSSPAFGYADNRPRKQGIDLSFPDNPYTKEVEGAGGDPIDISWAVDSEGNYVDLDSIHFVKIVSGSLTSAGWLGEISTDVGWVEAVQPQPAISGKDKLLVVHHHPSKILVGDSLKLETVYFERGRKADAIISFSSKNEPVLAVNYEGLLFAHKTGHAEILISAGDITESVVISVVMPDSMHILTDFSLVNPGDSLELIVQVFDNELEKLDIPVQFTSSNPAAGKVIEVGRKSYFVAEQAGETVITFFITGFEIEQQIVVKVLLPDDKVRIYFTIKTEDDYLLPFQWIDIPNVNLNEKVDARQGDYSGLERRTLFHALVAGLQKSDVPFLFKDDDAVGGKLYLHSVENDGLFYYGWGGKTEPEVFARSWIARLNSTPILNDFDKSVISNGDTIALYHVPDISTSWNYFRLLSNKDSAAISEEIEVLLEQTACEFKQGEVFESGFVPVENAEVFAGSSYFTSETGKAVIMLETDPPLVISSGNNAVLISKKLITGLASVVQNTWRVFPNPVENKLIVKGVGGVGLSSRESLQGKPNIFTGDRFSKSTIQLFSQKGRLILEKELFSDLCRLDLSIFAPGIYYLVILHQGRTETHKIIKK